MISAAAFSRDGVYRYALRRQWGVPDTSSVLFIGLNPSTADATQDDPTIRRCVRFARDWGYSGMWMGNLYAFRSTKPSGLKTAGNPVGPLNDYWLDYLSTQCGLVVAAWGAWPGPDKDRPARVLERLGRPVNALGLTKGGQPRHPLYMRADSKPILIWEKLSEPPV